MDEMSRDHYLWLSGEAGKMLRREKPLRLTVPNYKYQL
jgi:hypothetical protein